MLAMRAFIDTQARRARKMQRRERAADIDLSAKPADICGLGVVELHQLLGC
jgi:hypothetical protein